MLGSTVDADSPGCMKVMDRGCEKDEEGMADSSQDCGEEQISLRGRHVVCVIRYF